MALVGSALSSAIQAALSPWNGNQLAPFSSAIGNGIVTALSGQLTFTTADTGTTPGAGVGIGTGITGMNISNISSLIQSTGNTAWAPYQNNGPGVEWAGFCTKIANAINTYVKANATLTSTDTPVFLGTGTVLHYAGVSAAAVKSAIVAAAPSRWASTQFPNLANAVATGLMTELLGHSPTDTVTITGSFTGPTPPGPIPGAGSGSGIVT